MTAPQPHPTPTEPISNAGVTVRDEGVDRFAVWSDGRRLGHFVDRGDAEVFAGGRSAWPGVLLGGRQPVGGRRPAGRAARRRRGGRAMSGAGLVSQASLVARSMHRGQVDKSGAAYIGHPARVAKRLAASSDEARAVAWLHDVVEDTDATLDFIAEVFPAAVVEAVDAITHRRGESRAAYYERVAANPLAREVKLADIADNLDPSRLALLDKQTVMRLRAKYEKALRALEAS